MRKTGKQEYNGVLFFLLSCIPHYLAERGGYVCFFAVCSMTTGS